MAKYTQADIDRDRQTREIVRTVKEEQEAERRAQKALERQAQHRERSKSKKGDPFVLWLDKKLDKIRPY